jgi:hypothetical protein
MRKLNLLPAIVFLCVASALFSVVSSASAESPYGVAWSRQLGTSVDDQGWSVAVSGAGNVYISGQTYGNLGGTNAGSNDAFVTKCDGTGNPLWSRQVGTAAGDYSNSVAVDKSGNAYLCGSTYGSLGGTNAGAWDAFVTKYDNDGNRVWSRQLGSSGNDFGKSVAVDASGNVFIRGSADGTLPAPSTGTGQAFLAKYNSSGSLLWSRQLGGPAVWAESRSVAIDASGNAYISGGTFAYLGGPIIGSGDAFLSKFDGSGNLLWSTQIGSPSNADDSRSVAVDASGNAYISGYTLNSIAGPNAGGYDAFLIKYAAVPEPMTLVLLAIGAATFLTWKKFLSPLRSGK